MSTDSARLTSRIDFFESCIDQLKRDLPKYLKHQNDTNKTSKLLVKVLRNAASVESNQQLQSCLFLHAQKCESLEGQREVFSDCENQFSTQIEQAKVLLIAPLREVLADLVTAQKKATQQNDPRLIQEAEHSLPVHADLFEKHRVKALKNVLMNILTAELRFHCKAVEEISLVLTSLRDISEEADFEAGQSNN